MYLNNNKFKLLNTIDIAIIVIVIAIVFSGFFKIKNQQIFMLFDKSSDYLITVNAPSDVFNATDFEIGEKVYLSDGSKLLGIISSVKNIKEKRYTAINNSLMYDYSDKNVGVLIEIKTKVKESQSKKYINGSVFVARGTRLSLRLSNLEQIECVVEDIAKI